MITLEANQTLRGYASIAAKVTLTVTGMELDNTTGLETYKVMYQGQIPNSITTLYTVPAGKTAFISFISAVNTDSSDRTFELYVGGSAAANKLTPMFTVPAGGLAEYG